MADTSPPRAGESDTEPATPPTTARRPAQPPLPARTPSRVAPARPSPPTAAEIASPPEPRSTRAIEQELKLAATPAAQRLLASAESLAPGLHLGQGETRHVRDRYLDTPDRSFLRAGFLLRERVSTGPSGERHVLTLKGLSRRGDGDDGVQRRLEVEGPLVGAATDEGHSGWPGAVLDLAMVIAGSRLDRLETIVELRQLRTRRDVHGPRGALLGELSIDEARSLDRAGGEAVRWQEVEFEIVPCAAEHQPLQERAMDALRDLEGLEPTRGNKFERALRALAEHPPGAGPEVRGIQPELTMSEAARLIWRTQLVAMLLHEAGARRGDDIEYVHAYRVAIRRSRAAARLFGDHFEPKAIKPYIKHMKDTARLLGAVRDRDVALAKLAGHQDRLEPEEAAAMNSLAERWRRQRREAYDRLLPWLDSPSHRRFVRDFSRFCATPGAGARTVASPTPHQIRHVLPEAIWGRFCAVRAYEPLLEADDPPVETLHDLRIDCKRLRYTIEPVRPLLGREGHQLVKRLKRLQDHLGDLNDAGVTLADLGRSRLEGDDPAAVDHYVAVQQAEERRLRDTFRQQWLPFVGEENRARLGRALARL